MDTALDCVAYVGLGLSAVLMLLGAGNAIIFTALWLLYHSLVNVGQRWYACVLEHKMILILLIPSLPPSPSTHPSLFHTLTHSPIPPSHSLTRSLTPISRYSFGKCNKCDLMALYV